MLASRGTKTRELSFDTRASFDVKLTLDSQVVTLDIKAYHGSTLWKVLISDEQHNSNVHDVLYTRPTVTCLHL